MNDDDDAPGVTQPELPRKPGWRPRAFELADPTAAPDPDWTPGPIERALRRAAGGARPWMLAPALAVTLGISSLVTVPVAIEHPGDVVDAADLVAVEVPDRAGRPPGHTGAYLVPLRSTSASALDWLLAVALPSRAVVAAEPVVIDFLDPVESALLMGAGIAPGRGDAELLGLRARFTDTGTTRASLGVALEIFDRVSTVDVSRGRRVLALGAVTADGSVGCPGDARESLRAAGPDVELVLLGADCSTDGLAELAPNAVIRRAPTFPDAIAELSGE